MSEKTDIIVSIDEAGNPNDEDPFVISAVIIKDLENYLELYDQALKEVEKLTGKRIRYFKWSEDTPKPSKLGKDIKGIFITNVLTRLEGFSVILDKKKEKLSNYSAILHGKIIGLKLREYVVGKRIKVYYDRTPILREADKQYIYINFRNWTLANVIKIDFTGHDKCKLIHPADYVSGIVREYLLKDKLKEEYRQYLENYYHLISKRFHITRLNLRDYLQSI